MEWLSTNWLWMVLGLGVAWLLFKGGMGCGLGGHGSHGAHSVGAPNRKNLSLDGQGAEEAPRQEQEEEAASTRRRRRGC